MAKIYGVLHSDKAREITREGKQEMETRIVLPDDYTLVTRMGINGAFLFIIEDDNFTKLFELRGNIAEFLQHLEDTK